MSDTEVSGAESVFSPPPIQPPGVLLPSVPGGATGGEVEQVDGTTILDPLLGPTQEGEGGKGCETPKPLPKPCLPPLEHASTSSRPKECAGPNPDYEIRERETQLSAPQREEDECGGPVGINASKTTNAHQGQRSPPASTTPALPTQISPATRETALPGRAYRWRWTPEHKLQPELKPESRRVKRHPSPGSDESDIPPFAERMRFFEETSRSRSVSHLPGLVCRAQRPKVHPTNHRRYSDQDTDLYCPPEGGEPSNPEQNCSSSAHKPEDPKLGLNVDIQSSKSLCDSSTFCPVTALGPQDRSEQQQEISSISSTPAEVELRRENEQTQPNRKFSPTQRDQRCTGDLQTAEGALTPDCQSLWDASEAPERLLACSVEVEAEQSQEQAAAGSENKTGICERLNRCAAPHRGGIVESNEPPRRKRDPPPRPPPPNWAQFRHRRASCHNLLSSPPSPPPSLSRRESPLHPLPCPEVSRQRSHSFPLRDGGECLLHGPTLTPGPTVPQNPTLMHRVFRPVAPPAEQNPPLRYPTLPFDAMRLTDMRIAPQPQPRFYALKGSPVTRDDRRDALKQQMEAERERRPTSDTQHRLEAPVYSVQYSSEVPVGENGSVLKGHLPEPYFTMTCGPQRRTSGGNPKPETTPTHNAVAAAATPHGAQDTAAPHIIAPPQLGTSS
ncbi:serine/arginine repetitive matrix protein 1-like [Conger conger]|uniref:serine/arginine repetitive matrix protein 1-like n=1 Tax=Conger conger TaxID=82655 RepID=UPI002A59C740|nr:serine/arginine repetitive matrix protein 1-like [Conger conger]